MVLWSSRLSRPCCLFYNYILGLSVLLITSFPRITNPYRCLTDLVIAVIPVSPRAHRVLLIPLSRMLNRLWSLCPQVFIRPCWSLCMVCSLFNKPCDPCVPLVPIRPCWSLCILCLTGPLIPVSPSAHQALLIPLYLMFNRPCDPFVPQCPVGPVDPCVSYVQQALRSLCPQGFIRPCWSLCILCSKGWSLGLIFVIPLSHA